MPHLKWHSELKARDKSSFETENWKLNDLFRIRWNFEKTGSISYPLMSKKKILIISLHLHQPK